MDKETILEYFKDLNQVYNEPLRLASLAKMLDDLIVENHKPLMEVGKLNAIRKFIVEYIMRDDQVMYSDEARDVGPHHIDLIYVIASLYEELHKEVTGEPYEYMFHWANKVGSWVDDDLFSEENYIKFLEELQNEHIND